MRSWTFSLSSLLGVITLLSLDLGAAVSDSYFMASAAYTLFLGILCFAIAASFLAGQESRTFWVGFAVFGIVYWLGLFYAHSPPSPSVGGLLSYPAPAPGRGAPSYFITDTLLDLAEEMVVPRRTVGSHVYARWQGGGYYWGTIIETDGSQYLIKWDDGSTPTWQTTRDLSGASTNRRVALHTGVATLWAILGGAIVAMWAGRRKNASSTRLPDGSSSG